MDLEEALQRAKPDRLNGFLCAYGTLNGDDYAYKAVHRPDGSRTVFQMRESERDGKKRWHRVDRWPDQAVWRPVTSDIVIEIIRTPAQRKLNL